MGVVGNSMNQMSDVQRSGMLSPTMTSTGMMGGMAYNQQQYMFGMQNPAMQVNPMQLQMGQFRFVHNV